MQDAILIDGLKVKAQVGILPWEKQVAQPLLFDVKLLLPLEQAARNADLSQSVDYAAVAAEIERLVGSQHHDLIETLAEKVCDHLLATFTQVEAVTLTLRKPAAVPAAQSVGLQITRRRNQSP